MCTRNFAKFITILRNSEQFCAILRFSAQFYTILGNSTRFRAMEFRLETLSLNCIFSIEAIIGRLEIDLYSGTNRSITNKTYTNWDWLRYFKIWLHYLVLTGILIQRNLCHKLCFSNPCIFPTQYRRPWIFQTLSFLR